MPTLKDFRTTKDIALSAYPDSRITVYDSMLFKHTLIAQDLRDNPQDPAKIAGFISVLIRDWNFQDEAGNILPVSVESLSLLKPDAITELMKSITDLAGQKKTS